MNRPVTQSDVAKRAGVHVSTVSLALRNHPSLPESTRQKIRALAEEMGYRPDPTLGALIQYRSKNRPLRNPVVVAYVTRWDTRFGWRSDPPHAEFYEGASRRADELGYQMEHFWLGEEDLTHKRLSDMLAARGIHGLIIASHIYEIDDTLAFDWSQFSGVKIDCIPHEPALHSVTNNQRSIIQQAVRQTLALGYRRIGFVFDRRWDNGVDLAWTAGFYAEQARLPVADRIPPLLHPAPPTEHELPRSTAANEQVPKEELAAWIEQYRPEVIISHGRFVEKTLQELRLVIPRDIAYVDVLLQEAGDLVAGVRQNCRRVGELAMEILAGQLQQNIYGIPTFPTTTLVEGTWVPGKSLPPRR